MKPKVRHGTGQRWRFRNIRSRNLRVMGLGLIFTVVFLFLRNLKSEPSTTQHNAPHEGVYLESARGTNTKDYTRYVDVFWGTENGGNDFPGVARPWGMVKLGPDNALDSYSGYSTDGAFSGFSMMHMSGTGGAPKYGTVSQLPVVGKITNPLSNITVERAVPDVASVGYYRAKTIYGAIVELAATAHAGFYQYTFPKDVPSNVVIDISHVLISYRADRQMTQRYKGGSITLHADGRFEGFGTYDNGWNKAPNWTIYFYGYFDTKPHTAQVFSATGASESILMAGSTATSTTGGTRVGGMFSFDGIRSPISCRVGISWISLEKARQNVDEEIPKGTVLQKLVQDTKSAWNDEVLSKITTTSQDEENLRLLYSSLYFMSLTPTNQTSENPSWVLTEPYYSDIFTLWDLFRCSTPLFHILYPAMYEEFIRSLIDIWRHDGYLPDARSSNYNGRTQVGSNADNVLADAFVKGLRGKINWDDGYAALLKDAEVAPTNLDPPDSQGPDASTKHGRGGLEDWLEYGFITKTKFTRSVSRAVEYAYNDFSLHQVAKGLGKIQDAKKHLVRSRNWRNHWNVDIKSLGFSGFVGPRNSTDWIEITPLQDRGFWGGSFYEGGTWDYSWTDIHDMAKMIELMGGRERTLARLETMFKVGANPLNPSGTIFDGSNEPTFNLPYLYNYLDRQDLSVSRSRSIAKKFKIGPNGLPGNSDSGAMQSWLLWNMIGLYPIAGQTTFLIHSPWLESMTLHIGNNKQLIITSRGGDGIGDTDFYVQSVMVNGMNWTKNWLTWNDIFSNGGTLEFTLGRKPKDWATGPLPPSPATEPKAPQRK